VKKLLTIIISFVFVLSFVAGCGKSTESSTQSNNTNNTTSSGKYVDGTYKATYDFVDGHGWKPQIEIVIKDKKISEVKFDYVNPEGKLKTQDEKYNNAMKAKVGTNPAEYAPKYEQNLVATQEVDKVEAVSGATHSFENFKALAKAALAKAEKGDTSVTILPMNDTYKAEEKDFDDHGWKASVAVTYENGKIVKVDFEEVNKDGKKKSEDTEYNTKMKAKTGISAADAMAKLEQTYLETGKVDAVSGATATTNKFKALVEQAIAMRK
jgi:major membrane immunogen (membrane-anchored lipoprotein)